MIGCEQGKQHTAPGLRLPTKARDFLYESLCFMSRDYEILSACVDLLVQALLMSFVVLCPIVLGCVTFHLS